MTGSHGCHPHASCSAPAGSVRCSCNAGWESIDEGVTCTDVVECGVSDNCDTVATCFDVGGSFTCSCNSGFEGDDGTACTPLNQADPTAVSFQVRLPYDAAFFDSSKQSSYRRAVSRVAGVPLDEVSITSISEAEARRRMLAVHVLVDTTVVADNPGAAASVVSALMGSKLNAELGGLGLEDATLTRSPSVVDTGSIEEDVPTGSEQEESGTEGEPNQPFIVDEETDSDEAVGGAAPIGAIVGGVLGGLVAMGVGSYSYFKMCRHSKDGAKSSHGVVDSALDNTPASADASGVAAAGDVVVQVGFGVVLRTGTEG